MRLLKSSMGRDQNFHTPFYLLHIKIGFILERAFEPLLAPPGGLRAPELPGVNPGVNPRSQGVIPERFKQKKILWRTHGRTKDGRTDVKVEIVV